MKKLLLTWLFVWLIFTPVSTQAEERTQGKITRLPQLMDCGTTKTIGERIAALGQIPFLKSEASMQIPTPRGQDVKILFGEVMIFMNTKNSSYSMVFKLPDDIRKKGVDLCVFGAGHKLLPAVPPNVQTVH